MPFCGTELFGGLLVLGEHILPSHPQYVVHRVPGQRWDECSDVGEHKGLLPKFTESIELRVVKLDWRGSYAGIRAALKPKGRRWKMPKKRPSRPFDLKIFTSLHSTMSSAAWVKLLRLVWQTSQSPGAPGLGFVLAPRIWGGAKKHRVSQSQTKMAYNQLIISSDRMKPTTSDFFSKGPG